jgi:prevent-host-death family protein
MATIPQKELRNNVGEVLRRAEGGEELTITVSGRPVAHLGPLERDPWVPAAKVRHVWDTPAPIGLAEDLERLDVGLVDPFASA